MSPLCPAICPDPHPAGRTLLSPSRCRSRACGDEPPNRTQTATGTCSGLQSSSVLLANIRDSCSEYLRTTGPECSRSLRTCSHYVRRACNHRLVLTFDANDHAGRSRSRSRSRSRNRTKPGADRRARTPLTRRGTERHRRRRRSARDNQNEDQPMQTDPAPDTELLDERRAGTAKTCTDELLEAVRSGTVTLYDAARAADAFPDAQRAAIAAVTGGRAAHASTRHRARPHRKPAWRFTEHISVTKQRNVLPHPAILSRSRSTHSFDRLYRNRNLHGGLRSGEAVEARPLTLDPLLRRLIGLNRGLQPPLLRQSRFERVRLRIVRRRTDRPRISSH